MRAHGGTNLIGLGRSFRIMDDDRSGHLDIDEFTKAVLELGIDIRKQDIRSLFKVFDTNASG